MAGCAVVGAIGVGVALLLTRGGEQAAVTFTPPVSTTAPPSSSVSATTAAATAAPAVAAVADTVADPVPLAVTILDRPADRTRSTRASFAFETGGDPAAVRCRLDGGTFAPCSSPIVYRGLDRGNHRFVVRASAGGTEPASANHEWTIVGEQGGGATTVEAAAGGGAETASPAETGPANEAAPANEAPKDTDPEKRDEPEQPPADTTPPAVSILGGPAGETTKTVAVFRFSANEPVSRVECSLDGGGYSRCYTPTRYDVGVGGHTFCVRAADRAGNLGGPACYSWTVAETPEPPPPTTQEQPPATTEQQPAGGGEQLGPLGTGTGDQGDDGQPPPNLPDCNPVAVPPC